MRLLRDMRIRQALRCPHCGSSMTVREEGSGSLVCDGVRRHCFDLSSSGYVNLTLPGQSAGGDAKQAVRARSDFLNAGYYAPVADALCALLSESVEEKGLLIDAGCGEGYYTERLAACGFSAFGADLSKFAVDAAAKRVMRNGRDNAFFAVGSVFSLPVASGSASAVVNIFAPCAESEYDRVLKDGGILAVVHAGPEHLWGLKKALYDTPRGNEARADLPKVMRQIREERVRFEICVKGQADIHALFAMTPYYWKTSKEDGEKLNGRDTLTTEVDMIISLYEKDSKKETV